MKKSFLAAAAVFGAALAITACGSGSGDKETTAQPQSQSEAETEESTAETTETDADKTESSEENVQQTSVDGLKVLISAEEKTANIEDGAGATLNGTFESISIKDDGYDKLKKAIEKSDSVVKERYDAEWAQGEDFIKDFTDHSGEVNDWSLNNYVVLSRCDDDVFSYTRTDDSYLGGAHPNSYSVSYNFDTDTGEELSLKDVVTDYDAVREYVLEDLKKQNEDQGGQMLFDDYEDTVDKLFNGTEVNADDTDADGLYTEDTKIQWIMQENMIYIIFNRYDIAPYAAGQITVEIPASSGLLSPNYFVQE